MVKEEFLSPEGYRLDGRRPHESRGIRKCEIGPRAGRAVGAAASMMHDGCAYVEMGLTKVFASIRGPGPVSKKSQMIFDRAVVTADFKSASFSTLDRKHRIRGDRAAAEKSLWLQKLFEHCILVDQYPRSQIDIYVTVLQDDGSAFSAGINAVSLALMDAGTAMKDILTSCTVGLLKVGMQPCPIVDLNYTEAEQSGSAQLILAIYGKSEEIGLLEFSSKIATDNLDLVIDAGTEGCRSLGVQLRNFALEHTWKSLATVQSVRQRAAKK